MNLAFFKKLNLELLLIFCFVILFNLLSSESALAAPTLDLRSSSYNITVGQSVTLSWSTTNVAVNKCYVKSAWYTYIQPSSNVRGTSGSEIIRPASSGTYTYGMICYDSSSGSVEKAVTVVVNPAPSSCELPWGGQIASGSSVTAYYESRPPCGVPCDSIIRTCTNGSLSNGTHNMKNCDPTTCNPPTLSLSVDKTTINLGDSVGFGWSSDNTDHYCWARQALWTYLGGAVQPDNAKLTLNGFFFIKPTSPGTYIYAMECVNTTNASTGMQSVQVIVNSPVCTGTIPTNATLCSGDGTGLTSSVARSVVPSCTSTKCEYYCNYGYVKSGSRCTKLGVVSASCGTNAQTYPWSLTWWPSTAASDFCSVGYPNNTPPFPLYPGTTTSWDCFDIGGAVNCLASRQNEPPPNTLPTANITLPTSNQNINTGTTLNFQGTGSDPDGDTIIAYRWNLGSCNGNQLSSNSSFSYTFNTPGTYTIYFGVSDSKGAWSINCPSRVIVVVTPQIIINASCGINAQTYPYTTNTWPVTSATAFCSRGSLSGPTPAFPNQKSSVQWTCNGSGGGINQNCTASRGIAPPPNRPPIANITLPASNQNINTGTTLNFQGTGSDPDGDLITTYRWNLGSCNGNLLSSNSSFSYTFNTPGTYTIYFSVSDSKDAWSINCPSRVITIATPNLCGTSNNQEFCQATPPNANLCSSGASSNFQATMSGWSWNCSSSSCQAFSKYCPPPCSLPDCSAPDQICQGTTCTDCNKSVAGTKNCDVITCNCPGAESCSGNQCGLVSVTGIKYVNGVPSGSCGCQDINCGACGANWQEVLPD